ncbi:MAG: non-ribosomal peptide synthetase [Cyanobacteria bacterium J06621_8]
MIATEVNLPQGSSCNSFTNKIYWLNKLSRELSSSKIETDYLSSPKDINQEQQLQFELPIAVSQKILKLTQKSNFSIYIVLLACWKILLQKYTGNNDLIVGSPPYRELESSSSQRSKIIPVRSTIEPEATGKSLIYQIKNTLREAYIHQDYDFDEIYSWLKSEKKYDFTSIFNTIFLLDNIHQSETVSSEQALIIACSHHDNLIGGTVRYNQQIFRDLSIKNIINAYINIVISVINDININLAKITFLNREEQQYLLENFNDNAQAYPLNQTINDLITAQAQKTPAKIAAINQGECLTYEQLNNQANQLAHLLKDIGVKPGEFIAIFKDRDLNFLIGILAILKAGGVYVPIDSTYPQLRIQYMLANSEARFLLTDSASLQSSQTLLPDCSHLRSIICLDSKLHPQIPQEIAHLNIYDRRDFESLATLTPEANHRGKAPAYMIYTSGSTGQPKGAIVRHDGAINHIYAQFEQLKPEAEFTFLQSAPASTDISVWQFLAPLMIGGKTVIADLETVAFAENLFDIIKSAKITVVELVPVLFSSLLEYSLQLSVEERELPDLRWMMLSGESTPIPKINQWLEIYPQSKIANAYGPTEAADDITQFIIPQPVAENQRTIPIGKPLANLNLYVLDQAMRLLPVGAPGEICVSGIGVGDGYWNNEEKTKRAFVDNPFINQLLDQQQHQVIYKTGDLGRWLSDGNLEFLGRIDHQTKIRGFRIELGEIEACLSQHPMVSDAIAIVREDIPDDKRIVAYAVPVADLAQDDLAHLISRLRDFLNEKLPGHMIPSGIVLLETLPIAPSGKVDRQALPIPQQNESEVGFVAPRSPTEEIVADIWSQVLKQESIGIYNNFFNLGGHSLLATQVISKLRKAFEIELPLRSLFEAPTVAQLVVQIEAMLTVRQLQPIDTDVIDQNLEEIEL